MLRAALVPQGWLCGGLKLVITRNQNQPVGESGAGSAWRSRRLPLALRTGQLPTPPCPGPQHWPCGPEVAVFARLPGSNPAAMEQQPAGVPSCRGSALTVVSRRQTLQSRGGSGWGGPAKATSELLFKTTVRAGLSENIPFPETWRLCLFESARPLPSCVYFTHAEGPGGFGVCVPCYFFQVLSPYFVPL